MSTIRKVRYAYDFSSGPYDSMDWYDWARNESIDDAGVPCHRHIGLLEMNDASPEGDVHRSHSIVDF